jgi:plasmid replication initiation protein
MANDLVVKTNRLNMAIHNLSLTEIRIIQLAIVDARETDTGLSADKPLRIQATRYAEVFGTTRQTAYGVILEAETNLFERRFTFIDEKDGKPVKSRWVQQVKYLDAEGAIEIIFTAAVIEEIKRIDGSQTPFTEYLLQQISDLSSVYATRLYELLIQWKAVGKTPVFELNQFREQLGLGVNEYDRMYDFKKRILDLAITQINTHTDITAIYEQHKRGRVITGFSFTFKQKSVSKETKKINIEALLQDESWVSKHSQIGESWEQARARLRQEAKTGKFTLSPTI